MFIVNNLNTFLEGRILPLKRIQLYLHIFYTKMVLNGLIILISL